MRTSWQHLIETQEVIIADGGMGTLLLARGLERGSAPELWNVEHPEVVRNIHASYVAAGAQIILSNSFGANRLRLSAHHLEARAVELNTAAARLARTEADRADYAVLVAGSMGPTGILLEPLGELRYEDAVAAFSEQASALIDGGVDVLWIETMSDLMEVRAAVEACQKIALSVPRVTTMTFDTHGRTMMGVTPEKALTTMRELGVAALGANCGNGPAELESVIEAMRRLDSESILIAKANAGHPHMEGQRTTYDATPEIMAAYARRAHDLGARIIGSCCGSTPDHTRAIATALREPRPS